MTKGLNFDSVSNDEAINLFKAIWYDVFKSDAFKNDGSSFCTLSQFMEMTKKDAWALIIGLLWIQMALAMVCYG
jgi:hypothetical protein